MKNFLLNTPYHVIATSRSEQNWSSANLDPKLMSRITFIPLDVTEESTIQNASKKVIERFGQRPLRAVVNSAGFLLPEKSLKQIELDTVKQHFMCNAIGPLIFAKHFSGLLAPPEKTPAVGLLPKSIWVNMSARTGSIGDNHLGGWYSYRMSKAAINQLTKTMAAELARKGAIVVSMHPGTVVC